MPDKHALTTFGSMTALWKIGLSGTDQIHWCSPTPKRPRSSFEAAVVFGNQINTPGAAMSAKYFAHELEVARMPEIHHGTVQRLARGVY